MSCSTCFPASRTPSESGRRLRGPSPGSRPRWEHTQQDLKHEAKRLGDAIDRAARKRDVQKGKVNPRSLHIYETVRQKRGGGAVARIQGGACGGCRIALPDALRRRAFSTELLAQCPNCERILYIG